MADTGLIQLTDDEKRGLAAVLKTRSTATASRSRPASWP
jgi:hypothetical protein